MPDAEQKISDAVQKMADPETKSLYLKISNLSKSFRSVGLQTIFFFIYFKVCLSTLPLIL